MIAVPTVTLTVLISRIQHALVCRLFKLMAGGDKMDDHCCQRSVRRYARYTSRALQNNDFVKYVYSRLDSSDQHDRVVVHYVSNKGVFQDFPHGTFYAHVYQLFKNKTF